MNQKRDIFVGLLLALVLISGFSLYYFFAAESPSNFKVIEPEDGLRVGDRLDHTTYAAFTPLLIYYNGPEPEVWATITQSGYISAECHLISGLENDCYSLKLSTIGQNQYVVTMKTIDGRVITDITGKPFSKTFKVYWKPYNIFESFSAFIGGGNLRVGFLRIMFVILIISFALSYTKTVSPEDKLKNAFISAWVVISLTSFGIFSNGPGSTVLAFYGTILFWVGFSYFIFSNFLAPNSKAKTPKQPSSGSATISRVRPNSEILTRLPQKESRSLPEVVDGKVEE